MDFSNFVTRGMVVLVTATSLATGTDLNAGTSEFFTYRDGKVLDQDDNGTYDTIGSSISIRYFEGILAEKGVMTFDLSELQGRRLTSVELNARVAGYTSSTSTVSVTAFSDDLDVDLADATSAATPVGQYNPTESGLNQIQVSLDTDAIQSLLDADTNLTLRIESNHSGTNTQIGSSSSSWPPSLTVSYADFTEIHSLSDGRILDSDGDGQFDSINSVPSSLSIRTFGSLKEVSVSNFDVAGTVDMAAEEALLHIKIAGIANGTSLVEIYGFNDNLTVELEDATTSGLLLGSYNPTDAGLGSHTIPLDTDTLNQLIEDGGALTLRFSSGQNAANTQLNSMYLGDAPTLELDLVPAPPPGPGC